MRSHSPMARALLPLASLVNPLFVACCVLMAVVWLSGFGEGMLADPDFARKVPNRELRAALGVLARGIDATWILLGAVSIYLGLVRAEGLATARRWAGLVVGVGFVVSAASAITRWPLGPVHYPANLGWKIGPVPFAVPLLWFVVVLGAREAIWRLLPRASHAMVAVATGVLTLLTVVNLEPVAWKYRAWWIWYPGPDRHATHTPWQNFASWLIISIALAWTTRTPHVVPRVARRPIWPVVAILFLNLLALLTHARLRWG